MTKLKLDNHSPLLDPNFVFGVATSSFQIEGDRNGRADCIWDTFCGQQGTIKDNSNGDRACEHVKHWQHDIDMIANLGVDSYRLSVAWARVINADGSVNQVGLHFYERLVNALNERGISSHVTLYHWDLPQYHEKQGGWLNRETAYRFAEFAAVVVGTLGDRVASYSTINEPFCSAYLSYEAGIHAPGANPVSHDSGNRRRNGRQAAHHLLLAHALALPRMRELAPQAEHGIVLNFSPCHAESDSVADKAAAATAHDYHNRWYLQPLLQGSYPGLLDQLPDHEHPDIEAGDLELMHQPLAFLGVSYYTRTTFKATSAGWFKDVPPTGEELTTMGWEIYPQGLTEILTTLKKSYPNLPPVYITENGVAHDDLVDDNQIHDDNRIDYFQQHLNAVEDCIQQGVEIKGYYIWSLMDNFEWAEGYTQRFGIVHIDFETGERRLKDSAKAWQQFLQSRQQLKASASSC